MRSLYRNLCSAVLVLTLASTSALSASAEAEGVARPLVRATPDLTAVAATTVGTHLTRSIAEDHRATAKLPGLRCKPRVTPRKCAIFAKYRAWLAYLKYVGKANPNARWTLRQLQYLRSHPAVDRRVGPASIFRHPGKRAFRAKILTRRDRRTKAVPAEAFAKGGGPNYCSTLTISRLIESSWFKSDLFTAYHKVKWCWDANVVYNQGQGNWTEVAVHDGLAIENQGEISSHADSLPTRTSWYSSQQWSICNCAFRIGVVGHWQPLWRVWARPGGGYDWNAHW